MANKTPRHEPVPCPFDCDGVMVPQLYGDSVKSYCNKCGGLANGDFETDTNAVIDRLKNKVERLSLPPEETLSEHPGCVHCMSAENSLRPGQVCPKCGDRLPTLKEYWLRKLTWSLNQWFPTLNMSDAQFEYCEEKDWDIVIAKLHAALAEQRALPVKPAAGDTSR